MTRQSFTIPAGTLFRHRWRYFRAHMLLSQEVTNVLVIQLVDFLMLGLVHGQIAS